MESKLPKGWTKSELRHLVSFVLGGDWGIPSEDIIEEEHLKVLCIRGSEIKNWRIDKGNTAVERAVKLDSLEKRKLVLGDILIEISGGGPDQPVGRTVYIDEEALSHNSTTPKVCTNFLRLIRIKQQICPYYIFMFLQYFYLTGEIVKYQGGSNNLRNLRYKEFEQIEIPLPPLKEQERIASKLDYLFGKIDTLRQSLDKIPNLLKDFRQQVLNYAVTGKLTEEWRKGKELEEWKEEKAQDCCIKVQSGGTPKGGNFSASGIPFLKVYNIVNNKIDFDYNPQYVTKEIQNGQIKKSIVFPFDVVMNIVGPPLKKVALIPDTHKEWNINQAITLFRPKQYLDSKYLFYFLAEGTPVDRLVNETRGVVGQVNISLTQCREIQVSIPPLLEQQEIANRVENLFIKADQIEKLHQSLEQQIKDLPQALLLKAFKGELVEQLPTDGDARELLEEIKNLKKKK